MFNVAGMRISRVFESNSILPMRYRCLSICSTVGLPVGLSAGFSEVGDAASFAWSKLQTISVRMRRESIRITARRWMRIGRCEAGILRPRGFRTKKPQPVRVGVLMKMLVFAGSARALDEQGALANTTAEVVQLGAADLALVEDLNLGNAGGVKREHALNAFAVGDFTDGE